jgi:alginate O-acetyltransferase complex protein AlgI
MVFSSHLFLFYFLPLALLCYYAVPRRGKHLVLTLLSYLFYGWANPLFVVLMLGSTLIDYVCGRVIMDRPGSPLVQGGDRTRSQKWAVAVSICSNLSLLGFFKYCNFGVENYNGIVEAMQLSNDWMLPSLHIILPLGISFYTFQSMSYTIDVYRGDARGMTNFVDFACYVSMFPQLVAGPIIRFQEIEDQLRSRQHTWQLFSRGVAFFCMGMAKKVLLANPCGKVADLAFDAGGVGVVDAWTGAVAYSFQIYFDFSAYTDMAIGLGCMLGFVFAKNFDSPYHAESITEFWRRWHISLSTWLRDYLYIPLGGNKKGKTRTYINLALVMLIGGLWHGAAWNFIVWGAIHGAMLAFERSQGKDSFYRSLPRGVRIAITYLIVVMAWVFFRAPDLSSAVSYCASMFGMGNAPEGSSLIGGLMYQPYYLLTMAMAAVVTWFGVQSWDWTRRIGPVKAAVILGLFFVSIVALNVQSFNPFIYFIF